MRLLKCLAAFGVGYAFGYLVVNEGVPRLLTKVAMVDIDDDYAQLCYWAEEDDEWDDE